MNKYIRLILAVSLIILVPCSVTAGPYLSWFRILGSGDYGGSGDLSNSDADLFQNLMTGNLSYNLENRFDDGNISKKSFSPNSEVGFLYFTGHGSNGTAHFLNGQLSSTEFSGKNVTHMMFASCLTVQPLWKSHGCFDNGTKTVLGYHKVSYDAPVDDDIVGKFIGNITNLDPLGDPGKFVEAWKKANTSYSADMGSRWSAAVKGQYFSAGTSDDSSDDTSEDEWWDDWFGAASSDSANQTRLQNPVFIEPEVCYSFQASKANQAVSLVQVTGSPSGKSIRLNSGRAATKSSSSAANGAYIEFPDSIEPVAFSAQEAYGRILEFLAVNSQELPSDAELFRTVPIYLEDESGARTIINFYLIFKRVIDGRLAAGASGDGISFLVGSEGVISCTWLWRDIDIQGPDKAENRLDPVAALTNASSEISRITKGTDTVHIVACSAGYFSPSYKQGGTVAYVPCWHFLTADGYIFHADMKTGKLLF
ncbi:MAG: DUF6345 domain-containing protein [Candidatus Wallbacteria bacterium]|nr:DUF6345 domain-containing protein [Candidatus Wallbacteria bacterium]